MSKHTPGPWKTTTGYYAGHAGVSVAKGAHSCCFSPEDAARIVACVNACEGINPEAVPEMLGALKEAQTRLCRDGSECNRVFERVRAAIAKAEDRS